MAEVEEAETEVKDLSPELTSVEGTTTETKEVPKAKDKKGKAVRIKKALTDKKKMKARTNS